MGRAVGGTITPDFSPVPLYYEHMFGIVVPISRRRPR